MNDPVVSTPSAVAAADRPEPAAAEVLTSQKGVGEAALGRQDRIVFSGVSRFYGEVLGVNRVHLSIPPGITGLVGPNGSGKTTLMNLTTGLLQPTRGRMTVLGETPERPERMFRLVGYCSQYDSFPKGLTGYQFIYSLLRVHGFPHGEADKMTWRALERVKLTDAARRRVAGYSKGMRQRVRLAQALAHDPQVMVLDEPLNGLDPMARAEVIALFRELRDEGRFLLVSSHILHELDVISDQVIFIHSGYIVAEGEIEGVRDEIQERPTQVMIRCDDPRQVAAKLFAEGLLAGAHLHADDQGLLVSTKNADRFFLGLNQAVVDGDWRIESVALADADVGSVYDYLIGEEGQAR